MNDDDLNGSVPAWVAKIAGKLAAGRPMMEPPTDLVESDRWGLLSDQFGDVLACGANVRIEAVSFGYTPEFAEELAQAVVAAWVNTLKLPVE